MPRLRLLSKSPESAIEWLASRVKNYLHLPDPASLYALMGSLAANILEGPPVWLMYVGPPGCGKTELLNTLGGVPGMFPVDSVDGPAAFLSGTGKKDIARNATGGLLNMVGLHGGVVIKDFTGVLSLEPGKRKLVLDCLRQAYDGKWSRPVGADGGRMLHWPMVPGAYGHAALFAGVTGEIDQHHAVSASLGERWVYFRLGSGAGEQFSRASYAIRSTSRNGWRHELQDMMTAFVMSQDLEFGKRLKRRELGDAETLRIIRMASVAAMCRSAVPRDPFRHEVMGVPETENFARISTQLSQLFVGMEYVGVSEPERWRVLAKVALDSMPLMRRLIIREAVKSKQGAGYVQLVKCVGASEAVITRAVEDLALHGVVTISVPGDKAQTLVRISDFVRDEWEWGSWGN